MRFTISRKLSIGFGSLVLFVAGMGGIALWQGQTARSSAAELDHVATTSGKLGDFFESVVSVRLRANQYLAEPGPEREQKFFETVKSTDDLGAALVKDLPEPSMHTEFEAIKALLADYAETMRTITDNFDERQPLFTQQMPQHGNKAANTLTDLANEAEPEIATLASLSATEVQTARLYVTRFLTTLAPTDREAADKNEEVALASLQRLVAAAGKTKWSKPASDAAEAFGSYVKAADQVLELSTKIEGLQDGTLDKIGPEIAKHQAILRKQMLDYSTSVEEGAVAAAERAQFMALTAAGIATVVGVVMWITVSRGISRPVAELSRGAAALAQGDLTAAIEVKQNDELGDLAKSLATSMSSLRNMIQEVASTTRQVAAASTQIAASAEEMAAGLKNQEEQTTQVSAAVEEMAQSVTEVAKKGAEAAKAAQDSGKDATQGGEVVQGTVTEMKTISEQVNQSAQAVADLGKKSEAIGQIIGVINDIADQTNLLALNAAIEAARAGEHGRGFAVVADEVRKLAERTTQATDEVAKSIREIQGETSKAVEMINAGTQRVGKGVELASSAGEALQRIVSGSQNVQSMVHSIAAAAEEQSAASEQIARSVEAISAVTRESNQAASQSAQAAAELSTQSEKLNALVGKFRI